MGVSLSLEPPGNSIRLAFPDPDRPPNIIARPLTHTFLSYFPSLRRLILLNLHSTTILLSPHSHP